MADRDAAPPYRFDADGHLVIDTPRTPGTWWNYLFNDDTFLHFTQTGQGPSWIRRPRIVRWNSGYRYVYLRDPADGAVWCPTWAPLATDPDAYRCVHAPCWSRIDSERGGVRAAWRAFVPRAGQREIWTLELTNPDDSPRRLEAWMVFGFEAGAQMGWRAAWDQRLRVLGKHGFPLHADYEDHERLRHLPLHTCVAPTAAPDAHACCAEDFFAGDAHGAVPAAVAAGGCDGTPALSGQPLAALGYRLDLAPGANWTCHLLVGGAEDPAAFAAERDRLADGDAVDDELAAVEAAWAATESRVRIATPDPDLDRFVNRWLKKELVWETRLWRNDVSSPWRNELQDAMGYACFDAPAALPYLEAVTAGQRGDGFLQVWNTRAGEPAPSHPLVTKRHCDGAVWLAICWTVAIQAAGDAKVLDRILPFADGGEATLAEHLRRAVDHAAGERGAHGLVLMRDGDWTDPINGPGRRGRGESGWASMALAYACEKLAELADASDRDLAAHCRELRGELVDAIEAHLWTGSRYAYGFDDEGRRFGDDGDGRTYLNVQTWAIICGAAAGERAAAARRAIADLDTPCGPVLLDPPFAGWDPVVGRLSLKPAGLGENASAYCHGAAFAAFALLRLGDGDAAYDLVRRILPTNPEHPPERSHQPPIFQPNAYLGGRDAPRAGRSSRSLGTGTCAWLFAAVLDHLLGVRTTVAGLEIAPLLPRGWTEARVERVQGGCRYAVHLVRDLPAGAAARLEVDGRAQAGRLVPHADAPRCAITAHLPAAG